MSPFTLNNRRTFLKKLAVGSAAAFALPSLESFAKSNTGLQKHLFAGGGSPGDEVYWEMVKKQFAVPEQLMMVNAANLCPSPYFVIEKIQSSFAQLGKDVSFQHRARFSEQRKKSLDALAQFLGISGEEVGITRNTSEANNIVVNGLDLKSGDEVILWDQNHPSNAVAWENRAKRTGFTVKKVSVPVSPTSKEELVGVFERAITSKTKLVAFSHISNTSGIALPAEEICKTARARKVLTLVDGAQSFGLIDLDLRKMACDFYTSSTHKWLMGPLENGILYVKKENMASLWPHTISAGWTEGSTTVDEKYCMLGQRNETTAFALSEILEFHHVLGKKNIEDRVQKLTHRLIEGIRSKVSHAGFISPQAQELRAGIVIVELPGKKPQEMAQKLYDNYGIAAAATGGVRLSPHIYNTLGDIDKVVTALSALAV